MENELSQDPVLMEEFLVESEELLERMDQDMVRLEGSPQDAEILNRIFRAIHTIKGTSGFLGFEPIVRLSHQAEDVLNILRRGEIVLTTRTMDALLQSRDHLGLMLQDIRQGGLRTYELDSLLSELREAQKPTARETQPSVATPAPDLVPTMGSTTPAAIPPTLVPPVVIPPASVPSLAPAPASRIRITEVEEPVVASRVIPPVEETRAVLGTAGGAAKKSDEAKTLRVDVHKLDELVNLIGELVLERNRLTQISRDLGNHPETISAVAEALNLSAARLSFITDEMQTSGLKVRMVPIETVFRKFPRMVRDVAHGLGKEVELVMRGEDTELDKTMVELIGDPLVHLVRNALDHGLEMPDAREAKGKPRQGSIRLEARQEGDQIVIGIKDDGAGIDAERVARKAIEKGLVTAEHVRTLSRTQILDFLFLPGFSTAEVISDLSGRGVGMDVVLSNLKKMGGNVQIETELGQGTTVLLRLPLTLAIMPVLMVRIRDEIYALPLRSVIETSRIERREIHRIEGGEILCLRDRSLPLLRLGRIFDHPDTAEGDGRVVILGFGERRVALLVDQLLGQESTVVKPLSALFRNIGCLSGATISGDGRVRLVLDPTGLLATAEAFASAATQRAKSRGATA